MSSLMNIMFGDVDETLPLIEVVGEFSFLESDALSTDREFAAAGHEYPAAPGRGPATRVRGGVGGDAYAL